MRQVDCLQLCLPAFSPALSTPLLLYPHVETNHGSSHRKETEVTSLKVHTSAVSNLIKARVKQTTASLIIEERSGAPLCYHSNRAALELTGSPQSLLTNCLILLAGKMRSVIRNQTSSHSGLFKEWTAAWLSCFMSLVLSWAPRSFTSPLPLHHNMIYIWMSTQTAYLWNISTKSFPNFSAVQTCVIPLCRAPEEADSCSSSQWDICISGLFFIRSIFPSQRKGTLMSLKSHYGWRSVPAKTDFLWFCSGGEEMREAKSLWRKIQMDMAGHEGDPLKCTAPTASFHHGGVPCLAVSESWCDGRCTS